MFKLLLPLLAIVPALFLPEANAHTLLDYDNKKAVIFAYSRIGDSTGVEDSLPLETFQSHILEIVRGDYHALPLLRILEAFENAQDLPENTIALTFDAAGQDFYETAWPLLKEHNLPFTIFIAPSATTLDRDALKEIAADPLVTIGLHPDHYTNMALWDTETTRRHINNAKVAIRDHLGLNPVFFAYPYGMVNPAVRQVIEQSGFRAALGQQSGAAHPGSDLLLLPRFTMSSSFGSLNRFIMTAKSLPLPVSDTSPASWVIGSQTETLALGFTLDDGLKNKAENLSCFSNTLEKPGLQDIGNGRIEIRLPVLNAPTRLRVNCTLPASKDPETRTQRWRWLGFMFHVEH